MHATHRPILVFQASALSSGGGLDPEPLALARGLARAGLAVTVAAGCPPFIESSPGLQDEAPRRGWTRVATKPFREFLIPPPKDQAQIRWFSFETLTVPVDLYSLADSPPQPTGLIPEAAFREAVARTQPAVVLFVGRFPPRSLVEACRVGGIASVLFYEGMDDSPAEPHPPVDVVVALTEISASYYHEVYGHRPEIVTLPVEPTVPHNQRDPKYLLYIDPTAANGVYAFARIADRIGQLRPDIPIMVVEADGTEADLARCGLDLATRGNLVLMAPTRDEGKYWNTARVCLMPTLKVRDQATTLRRAMALGVPTLCSDRGAMREIAGDRVRCLPLPLDMTAHTITLPVAEAVDKWVSEAMTLWDEGTRPSVPGHHHDAKLAADSSQPYVPLATLLGAVRSLPLGLPVMPPGRARAVVLVPFMSTIDESCQAGLQALEAEGIQVIRRGGQSAIDIARNDMCSQAVHDGFESILFIDSDIGFNVRDALRLLARPEPIVSGVYAKKGNRSVASVFHDSVTEVVFGPEGGLYPLRHVATGFLRIRSEVLRRMILKLELPLCNTQWNRGFWPFFMPTIVRDGKHHHYLGEDWAFSSRLRQIGICLMADTTIRLWHVGQHHFGWEEAGLDRPRAANFRMRLKT